MSSSPYHIVPAAEGRDVSGQMAGVGSEADGKRWSLSRALKAACKGLC